jgi:hypothetical protein
MGGFASRRAASRLGSVPPTPTARQDSAVGVNPMMPYKVVSVRPLEHLRLAVRFADGLSGDVVLKESHLYGVFEALKDSRLFAEVHCRQGFVEWPGEIDLAPDAMYDEIKASGIWVLE